ncbi:MAG: FKBP-type peptidyl-prolyl cis-trans isomerase [Saprospirales bacterium]|nr:FKBP-type peptidyl-prolyl cis-trans isomerase [Saprospirales bacterium]MBK8491919.1 FKBP-type peptidyl-prolyl cis-trans isomerase [Saprospirales bacterium]
MRYILLFASFLFFACSSLPKGNEVSENLTANGFPYIHHIQNEGPRPKPGDYAYFHVIMARGDTVLYDSDTQAQLPMLQIPSPENRPDKPSPIIDGLVLMAVGDSLTVLYSIDSVSQMTYRFALKKISGAEQYNREQSVQRQARDGEEREVLRQKEEKAMLETRFLWKQYRTGQIGAALQESASGLQFVVLEEGMGAIPEQGQWIWVHYYAICTDDGKEVANTYAQARKFPFQLGQAQAPPGMEEATSRMKPGSRAVLFLPSKLGYGEKGYMNVPPNTDIVLYLEILEIE